MPLHTLASCLSAQVSLDNHAALLQLAPQQPTFFDVSSHTHTHLTCTGCCAGAVFCTIALEPLCSELSTRSPHVRIPDAIAPAPHATASATCHTPTTRR